MEPRACAIKRRRVHDRYQNGDVCFVKRLPSRAERLREVRRASNHNPGPVVHRRRAMHRACDADLIGVTSVTAERWKP
jgi:hypothetical protein